MKTQLLEDIGENADRIVERLPLPKAAAPAADPIATPPAATPVEPPAPPSARVWQVRAPRGEPSYRPADAGGARSAQFKPRTVWQGPAAPAPQPAVEPPAPPVHAQDIADEVAEIERALQGGATAQARAPQTVAAGIDEQEIADELAAIERALERSEAASAKPARSKRWLIAAGAAGSVLLAAGLVAATVQWYQDESKNVDTMNVLATSAASPAQPPAAPSAPVLPEAPLAASVAETPAAAPPPMVMLEQPAPPVKTAVVSEPVPAPAPTSTPAAQATPAPPAAEAVAPEPEPAPPVAKPRRKEAVARRDDDAPQRPAPRPRPQPAVAATESAPSRDEQMEETLRQCRAAGYHTAQCLEKKCQATKYGLACRG